MSLISEENEKEKEAEEPVEETMVFRILKRGGEVLVVIVRGVSAETLVLENYNKGEKRKHSSYR